MIKVLDFDTMRQIGGGVLHHMNIMSGWTTY